MPKRPDKKQISNWANKLRNVKYSHHGRDENGLDCFGILLHFCKTFDVDMPDYVYDDDWRLKNIKLLNEYHKYGKEIEEKEAFAGDVVLIKNCKWGINHVGIMISKTKVIHCTKEGVCVNSTMGNNRIHQYVRLNWDD